MKKLLFASLSLLIMQACSTTDHDPETYNTVGKISDIEIRNIQGYFPAGIKVLTFVARFQQIVNLRQVATTEEPGEEDDRIMLEVPFNNSSMIINLPQNPNPSLLRAVERDIPPGFIISDPQARTVAFAEIAHYNDAQGKVIGCFYQSKQSGKRLFTAEYMYSDRPVTITGTAEDWWGNPATYNLTLEKGWNMIVRKEDNTHKRTVTVNNQLPQGMEWKYATR